MLSGVTTNPSLAAKEGRSFDEVLTEITSLVDGPVSAEVISLKADEMVKEGVDLSCRSKRVVVKILITPDGLSATNELSDRGIKVNMTLIFSTNQALLASAAGASYVSPFVGRLDDIGKDGMKIVEEIADIYKAYDIRTEIIAASIRHHLHVIQAASAGADIATIPYKVFKLMAQHQLIDSGIERFLKDWEDLQKSI